MPLDGWRAPRATTTYGVMWALAATMLFPNPAAGQERTFTLAKGNRTYKLLAGPEAKGRKNQPLVVYLHPSGGPKLKEFTNQYMPLLRKRGCLVAVPLSRDRNLWPVGADGYIHRVIADVQGRYSVDTKRIVLLGISGGGQLALFVADRKPAAFRAVIAVSTNPVVVRGDKAEWFYPNRAVLRKCPYFVVCHITQGAALRYWRQVRARLAPAGASVSIRPVLGRVGHFLPPPRELGSWLDTVLAGKHPAPLADPQKAAVHRIFSKPAAALMAALPKATAAKISERLTRNDKHFELAAGLQEHFERSKGRDRADAAGLPVTQIRTEHKKWPIYIRVDARATHQAMARVLAAETAQTRLRGMLYQIYQRGTLTGAGRSWQVRIGSVTFPDRRKGWRTTLFIHAAAAIDAKPDKAFRWIEITLMDETQRPNPQELGTTLRTILSGLSVKARTRGPTTHPAARGK